jgi:hypothetical protein
MYDAASIETSFAFLLERTIGERGSPHDAGIFLGGDLKNLGELLEISADCIAERLGRLQFSPEEQQSGGAKAQLDVSVNRLRSIGKQMKAQEGREPEDFHWLIIGPLVQVIASLLNHLEGKGAPIA